MKKRLLYMAVSFIMTLSPFAAVANTVQKNNNAVVENDEISSEKNIETESSEDDSTEGTETANDKNKGNETNPDETTSETVIEPSDETEPKQEIQVDFEDVEADIWYADSVHFVATRGVMSGTSEKVFSPDNPATRGTIALIIKNIDGPSEKTYWSYLDVPEDSWYAEAVAWCSEAGVMEGYGGGYFGPDDSITREQLVSILYRYAQYKNFSNMETTGVELLEYKDYADISGYAGGPMQWALKNSIISGKENNMLDPKGVATRAEIAQIIRNFMIFYNL